ncbi:hypothetical protein [Azospirillum sp. B4]|uniref:hypothetical protein n=1 Tax=Azospirillum sp. B4 TaxID=95605 RepID=UPI0005CAD520|nr:hypothetical protein [Azospirillum sp. B4]
MNLAQRVGRLAELHVERRLTEKGWLCGNFNVSVENASSWDLFVKKGHKTRVIRVKGSSSFDVTWTVPHGPGALFKGSPTDDPCDWTAIVVMAFTEPVTYLLPTAELVRAVLDANLPAKWRILHLHFRQTNRTVGHPGQYGLDLKFERFQENWELE